MQIRYPDYAWILYGWYSDNWWRISDAAVGCSEFELAAVLERALVVQQYPIANTSIVAVGDYILVSEQLVS